MRLVFSISVLLWHASTSVRSLRTAGSGQRHPHRIEAELISALGMGTNSDVAAADQSRPTATRAVKLIHPMRRIFILILATWGSHIFASPSECEVAHTSRGINGGHQTVTARVAPAEPAGALFGPVRAPIAAAKARV
jgi:hypothetical protein